MTSDSINYIYYLYDSKVASLCAITHTFGQLSGTQPIFQIKNILLGTGSNSWLVETVA